MRIPFTPYVQTIKAEPHAPVVKPESYLRVKSEPLESAIKLERYERATKSEPYESMKFEHTPSPPLPSFIKCFPICYENKTSIEMDALLLSSGRQVLKGIPSLDATTIQACGFSEIKLSIFWPGYECINFMEPIAVKGKSNGQIAVIIANMFQAFVQRALQIGAPKHAGRWAITPSSPYARMELLKLRAIYQLRGSLFTIELETAEGSRLC
ncbi:hypothetical protein TRAPUB_525 [Trametes pubescens]|uniref:Uncharacterized protein n=1 Tax=Trametes pubescens TaxID=154538 RepID=A0A1M2VM03_TRAPU|nr:hypothetical protein TRAPUB_525 [Trametes pubescens]